MTAFPIRTNSAPMSRGRMGIATIRPLRRSGYVTQSLINQHGSYKAALDWLNTDQPQ